MKNINSFQLDGAQEKNQFGAPKHVRIFAMMATLLAGASFVLYIFLPLALSSQKAALKQHEQNKSIVDGVWNERVYKVVVACLADNKTAIWNITKDGTASTKIDASVPYDKPDGVLTVFNRQSEERKRLGIFIKSWTYAIPDTAEEKQWMTEHLINLYYDKEWRKSEAKLIEDLRTECEKKKIPLYVNLSGDLQGKWKKANSLKLAC